MKLRNELSNYFLPYQIDWITDESPIKLCPKSRRIGITYSTSLRRVLVALQKPFHDCWVLSRDEGKAKEFIDYCKKWVKLANLMVLGIPYAEHGLYEEDRYIDEHDVTILRLTFPNGSRIMALSSNPDSVAGIGGSIVMDEMALHRDQEKLFNIALPCTTWGGQVEMISTHRGIETFFNTLCKDAEGDNKRRISYHKTTLSDAVNQGFVEKVNGVRRANGFPEYTRESFIEEKRAECSSDQAFLQEYMCQPSSSDDSLLSWEWITRAAGPVRTEPIPGEAVYMGIDAARVKDNTDIWLLVKEKNRYRTKYCHSMKNVGYDEQVTVIEGLIHKYNVQKVAIDATGTVGVNLEVRLKQRFGSYKIDAIKFTNAIKETLAAGVHAAFERNIITIPDDIGRKNALYSIHKVVSSIGITRYQAPVTKDGHADEFWSLALAIAAAGPLEQGGTAAISVPLIDAEARTIEDLDVWATDRTADIFNL